jgi:hypothetical protein
MWGLSHLQHVSDGHSKRAIVGDWLNLLVTYRRSARLIIERQEASVTSVKAPM